jgi:hypothetical protein
MLPTDHYRDDHGANRVVLGTRYAAIFSPMRYCKSGSAAKTLRPSPELHGLARRTGVLAAQPLILSV